MAEAHSGVTSFGGWRRDTAGYSPSDPPVASVVLRGLPLLEEQIRETLLFSPISYGASTGIAARAPVIIGKRVGGMFRCRGGYEGLDGLFAATLGHEALKIGTTLMPEALGNGVYRHLYELNATWQGYWSSDEGAMLDGGISTDAIKPQRGTFAIWKSWEAWEWTGITPTGLRLEAPRAASPELTFETLGYALTVPATTNTAMQSTVLPRGYFPVLPSQFVWAIGPYSASTALNSSHIVSALPWAMTIENFLDHGYSPLHGLNPAEMSRTTSPTVSVEFTVPRYSNDTLLTWYRTQTRLMAHAKWTGPLIANGGGQRWALRCYFPACRIQNMSYGTTPQHTEVTCLLSTENPGVTPAGFPAVSHEAGPIQIETIGTQAAHQFL